MAISEVIKEKLVLSNEEVISLHKLSPYGEQMMFAVRHIKHPFTRLGEFARYHKSNESFILLDIYAQTDAGTKPIAYYDLVTEGNTVRPTFGSEHPFVIPQTSLEQLAKDAWGHAFNLLAFFVDGEYRKNNLGTFLLAASLWLLQNTDVNIVKNLDLYLTEASKRTWRRFGVDWKSGDSVPVASVANHPLVTETLSEFFL